MGKYKLFKKEISGIFTIPSGIVGTETSILERIIKEIPEVGILTTKSIGLKPKEGNKEPIVVQYSPLSFINAVGLTNPGAEEFARRLSKINIPSNKFLLISIFGDSPEEFREVAEVLYDFADGFELNISCPHSKQYGKVVGQNKELVGRIVKNVASLGKPVFIKLSPSLNIKEIIGCSIKNGISGITAVNTKGPESFLHDGYPVLANKLGGVSGKAILELGLKCVKEVRAITGLPIIACGGISVVEDIKRYRTAGADFFGIGSALAGMNTEEMKKYFSSLSADLEQGTNSAASCLKTELNMGYKKYKVEENVQLAEDLFLLRLNGVMKTKPGQFIFAWLPEKGEKPFSVLDDEPLSLLIQKRGCFSSELSGLKPADTLYIRGPYGNSPEIKGKTLLVGGGTGIAALYLFAKRNKDVFAILGAKDKNHLANFDSFRALCKKVYLTTENGEIGHKGLITDVLDAVLRKLKPEYCINCGPEPMIKAVVEREKQVKPKEIYSSIDFLTKCGIGLCGSCVTSMGYRNCVDGTFLTDNQIY